MRMPIYSGNQAVNAFIKMCDQEGWNSFFVIADDNTYRVLGEQVHQALQGKGWDVLLARLDAERLHTDSVAVSRVLAKFDAHQRIFVAVGSGTITDITRFTSHRSRNPFISFPTAGSVDAYTSQNSAMTIGEMKGSVYCQAPIAIFTDIPTIMGAPDAMTASGVADLLGKFSSTADWMMSMLIWGADFDQQIYTRLLQNAQRIAQNVRGISRHEAESMAVLMDCQYESGFCMADFGNSAPASGGEHHIAHAWEMMFHWEGREGLQHGDAVGVAALFEASQYERLRSLSKDEAQHLLQHTNIPAYEEQETAVQAGMPTIAGEIISSRPIFLQLSDENIFLDVRERILDQWHEIQTTAATVPSVDQMRGWLEEVGAQTSTAALGLSEKEARMGYEYGHYLRERFSINLLRKLFGW